jgi:hypothetical protein
VTLAEVNSLISVAIGLSGDYLASYLSKDCMAKYL